MPIVRIDVQEGKSTAYKRAILHGVRRAISFTLGVGDDRIMQRIIETPAENIDGGGMRSDSLTIVEVAMLAGHASDVKFQLYEAIVRELRFAPGIVARDIVVHVIDAPAECLCVGSDLAEGDSAGETPPPERAAQAETEREGESTETPDVSPSAATDDDD